MSKIQVKQLSKYFGDLKALKDINLDIPEDALAGLVGRNGSGKTTLFKCIAGLLYPNEGGVYIDDQAAYDNLQVLSGLIYGASNMPFNEKRRLFTLLDNYTLAFKQYDRAFADRLLKLFAISPKSNYGDLSQGQKSLFNYTAALASRAPITLLDEPVAGIDAASRRSVCDILLRDYIEHPRTIIVSSHMLGEMENILSHIILLDNGRLILSKSLEDVSEAAFRADGSKEALQKFSKDKTILYKQHGETGSFYILEEPLSDSTRMLASHLDIQLSNVGPEDYCLYKTNRSGGEELEALWTKQ